MMHEITFSNAYNAWNNALPLGNGRMGAMVFFRKHKLHIALNHYDCYYSVLSRYSSGSKPNVKPARVYEDYKKLTDAAREADDFDRAHYNDLLNPNAKNNRPVYGTTSYPMAGEIVIPLDESLNEFTLKLVIEEGRVDFSAKSQSGCASAKIWVAKNTDGLFIEMEESRKNMWGEAELAVPGKIGQGRYNIERGANGKSKWLNTSFSDKRTETAITMHENIIIASMSLHDNDSSAECSSAITKNNSLLEKMHEHAAGHKTGWQKFWNCTVRLPDYFLETLWHLHLYMIEIASGLGGKYFEQACGLNGLWDIRRPNLWASTWYWDVNIQEAFWPVFSANKLNLGKHFCDAYLSYAERAEDFALAYYNHKDWPLDYPHLLYNCIHPWCAQFLWRYYSYSGDVDFLRDKAYPVFVKQINAFKHIAVQEADGKLHVNYDISPEQGPITKDSVATLSSVKELLKYAIKAAQILGRPNEEHEEFARLLRLLPDYAKTTDGKRFKDSALATDNLFLRHPSILMPIFPGDEISKNSPDEIKELALATLKHAMENTEIGVFGFGWLACAAAKMGEGTAALRILYEKGVDYLIHSNGLGYEESERFANLCLITKPPLYPPAMTEPSGGIVMAVNSMLLNGSCAKSQDLPGHESFIEVFPAMPNGYDNLLEQKAQYRHQNVFLQGSYPAWEDCRFDKMLAEGGFEVSAELKNGKTAWIHVKSLLKGKLKILLPKELSPTGKKMIFIKDMGEGEEVSFGTALNQAAQNKTAKIQTRISPTTGRRIFLGEDRHTDFYKAVDSFTCAYLLGNVHRYQMLPYVFDFGDTSLTKNYDDVYRKPFCHTGDSIVFFGAPKKHGADAYNENLGYGFSANRNLAVYDTKGLDDMAVCDRKSPDDIRRDFVEGTEYNEFWIELPRGKYNALIISGDESEESLTNILLPHKLPHIFGCITGKLMQAGFYQCRVVPFMHEEDGIFKIALSTGQGRKWKLNSIFFAKEYYM